MNVKQKILAICGSASQNSSNLAVLKRLAQLSPSNVDFEILDNLAQLPHFKTEETNNNTPIEIINFRTKIQKAGGIIICTPEYVFSIPSGLKNAIEWCVSTVVFSDKPVGLITASAGGMKGHEELKLIMKTIQSVFTDETTLLIQGVKSKVNSKGEISDDKTESDLIYFFQSFTELINLHNVNKFRSCSKQ